jgi:hypothetical protein
VRIALCTGVSNQNSELTETEFAALLVKHDPVLRAYARVIVLDWKLVDEAIPGGSVTVWRKGGELEQLDGSVPWPKTVLRFKCLSHRSCGVPPKIILDDCVEISVHAGGVQKDGDLKNHAVFADHLRITLFGISC